MEIASDTLLAVFENDIARNLSTLMRSTVKGLENKRIASDYQTMIKARLTSL